MKIAREAILIRSLEASESFMLITADVYSYALFVFLDQCYKTSIFVHNKVIENCIFLKAMFDHFPDSGS